MFYGISDNDHDRLLRDLVITLTVDELIELRKACLDQSNQVQADIIASELERRLI
jgi:hypothetical protein